MTPWLFVYLKGVASGWCVFTYAVTAIIFCLCLIAASCCSLSCASLASSFHVVMTESSRSWMHLLSIPILFDPMSVIILYLSCPSRSSALTPFCVYLLLFGSSPGPRGRRLFSVVFVIACRIPLSHCVPPCCSQFTVLCMLAVCAIRICYIWSHSGGLLLPIIHFTLDICGALCLFSSYACHIVVDSSLLSWTDHKNDSCYHSCRALHTKTTSNETVLSVHKPKSDKRQEAETGVSPTEGWQKIPALGIEPSTSRSSV